MRIVILGHGGKGKTSMLKALTEYSSMWAIVPLMPISELYAKCRIALLKKSSVLKFRVRPYAPVPERKSARKAKR